MNQQTNEEKWREYLSTGYFASTDGQVKNRKGRILKGQDRRGYRVVTIEINGEYKNTGVHRIVATCFIDNPSKNPQVNHIDGMRSNNTVSNLEWCTAKENTEHAVLTIGSIGGSFNGESKFTPEQVLAVAGLLKERNHTPIEISKITEVSVETIRKIIKLKVHRKLLIDHGYNSQSLLPTKRTQCKLGHELTWNGRQNHCKVCNNRVKYAYNKLARETQAKRKAQL